MRRVRGDSVHNNKVSRLSCNDEFESVYLMDRYFCRTQNPDPKEFKLYEPETIMEAKKIYCKFSKVFESVGFSLPDIENIARVYLCSFLGLYKIENNSSKFLDFEKRFQAKNNTDSPVTKEAVYKKNRSDLNNFLKQKLPMLAVICARKSRNIVVDCEEKFYFKTKDLVDVNEEALKTAPYGYKGYYTIDKEEFKTAQKTSKSNNKKRFFNSGFHYFVLERKPAPFFALDSIIENEIDEDRRSVFSSGIIETESSSLFFTFDNLPRIEKMEMLEDFLRKNKKKKDELVKLATAMLEELR